MVKKFDLGEISVTMPALMALFDAEQDTDFFFDRHAQGDWGEGDAATNELALITGERLISKYKTVPSKSGSSPPLKTMKADGK